MRKATDHVSCYTHMVLLNTTWLRVEIKKTKNTYLKRDGKENFI